MVRLLTRFGFACGLAITLSAQSDPLLRASIVGSVSMSASPNYFRTLRPMSVQRLLLTLTQRSLGLQEARGLLADQPNALQDLLALKVVRVDGDRLHLNFALYTKEDQIRIRKVVGPYADSLAQALLAQKEDLHAALATYDAPGVDPGELSFLLLGCVSLDWDGLDLTAIQGYRAATGQHPDGTYVPYAEEVGFLSLKGIYWGSRTSEEEGCWFTSFGDDEARRLTPSNDHAGSMFKMMLALRESPRSMDELGRLPGFDRAEVDALMPILKAYGWVEARGTMFRIRIPVLVRRDESMVNRVRAVGRDVMSAWLRRHYPALKTELGELSYMRSGVPFPEGFTMIWHYLFGEANRRLVAAGLFADPYAASRPFKGSLPMIAAWQINP